MIMKNDTFWKLTISEYCKAYANFRKQFLAELGVEEFDNDIIDQHWHHLLEITCDCEGCREDKDCTVHIHCEDDEEYGA